MCIFSGPVISVSKASIFARSAPEGRQYLAYAMRVSARRELAMILPLPVPRGSDPDSVRWIDLKGYGSLFVDIEHGFANPLRPRSGRGMGELGVVEVGDFVASFVPSERDFDLLDPRFRLPDSTWSKLPRYRGWGFAVFQLKAGARFIHPMAFDFPRADRDRLFFPTLHIHDGEIHETARFDHSLYCQKGPDERLDVLEWEESPSLAGLFVRTNGAGGMVKPDAHVYRRRMHGDLPNADVWLA